MRNKQMSGRMSGKPTTALINHVMHASKKELRQMLISFITSEPTQLECEPIDDEPITEEELRATPMNDLNAVREIKEKYPERLTFLEDERKTFYDPAISMVYTNDRSFDLKTLYYRLANIEDIIYGEVEEK